LIYYCSGYSEAFNFLRSLLFISILSFVFLVDAKASCADGIVLSGLHMSSPEMKGNWKRLSIPLKRAGNLLLFEATVDSVRGNFILDTGAPYLVLNAAYFRQLAIQEGVKAAGVNGNSDIGVAIGRVNRLEVSSLFYESVDVDIVDLGHIENKRQMKILGLFGASLFSDVLMLVDVVHNQLVLYRTDPNGKVLELSDEPCDSLLVANASDLQLNFRLCDQKIFLPVSINGQKMNWILDTGAEANVVDAWTNKKVMRDFIISRRLNLTGSTGERQDALVGILPEIEVGKQIFTMQQTVVTSMRELSETCSLYIDGILGYNFLSQGVFTINFKNNVFTFYLYNSNQP
jgi:predicted aspartyl protease